MHVRPAGSVSWPELYCLCFHVLQRPVKEHRTSILLLHPYLFTVTYLLLILQHLLGPGLGLGHLTSFNISGSKYSQSSFGSRGYLCTVMASDLVRILTVTFSSDLSIDKHCFSICTAAYTSSGLAIFDKFDSHWTTSPQKHLRCFRHVPSGLLQHRTCRLPSL